MNVQISYDDAKLFQLLLSIQGRRNTERLNAIQQITDPKFRAAMEAVTVETWNRSNEVFQTLTHKINQIEVARVNGVSSSN